MPKEKQEKYGDDYFSDSHKNWFSNPDFKLFELIRKKIIGLKGEGPLRILDVGCGRGDFLKYLKERHSAFELHGIDLTDNDDPGIHYIKGDIMNSEIEDTFDVICNITVVEHLDSPHSFVKRMKNLLRPDGIMFTVTDNDDSMIYRIARVLKRAGISAAYKRLYDLHHLQCFSNNSLRTLMIMNDLDIVDHRNHNHPARAVDYPVSGIVTKFLYMAAVRIIFFLSTLCKDGILQVVICRRK
ncbi:MAG: class I SAM-dependent methyltransferase [Candidatus Omnitrophota bacterium]